MAAEWRFFINGEPVPETGAWPMISAVLDFNLDEEHGQPSIIAICPNDETARLITDLLNTWNKESRQEKHE